MEQGQPKNIIKKCKVCGKQYKTIFKEDDKLCPKCEVKDIKSHLSKYDRLFGEVDD